MPQRLTEAQSHARFSGGELLTIHAFAKGLGNSGSAQVYLAAPIAHCSTGNLSGAHRGGRNPVAGFSYATS